MKSVFYSLFRCSFSLLQALLGQPQDINGTGAFCKPQCTEEQINELADPIF